MEEKLKEKTFNSTKGLKVALKDIWASIIPDITKKLSLSMPKKLQTVKVANGYHTKY